MLSKTKCGDKGLLILCWPLNKTNCQFWYYQATIEIIALDMKCRLCFVGMVVIIWDAGIPRSCFSVVFNLSTDVQTQVKAKIHFHLSFSSHIMKEVISLEKAIRIVG